MVKKDRDFEVFEYHGVYVDGEAALSCTCAMWNNDLDPENFHLLYDGDSWYTISISMTRRED